MTETLATAIAAMVLLVMLVTLTVSWQPPSTTYCPKPPTHGSRAYG